MQGARTFSIFAGAAAFQFLLIVAVIELLPSNHACMGPRQTLITRVGLQEVPELYQIFGISDPAPPRPAQPPMAVPVDTFGCIAD